MGIYRDVYRDVRAERAYFIKTGKFQPLTHTDEHRHFFWGLIAMKKIYFS